MGGTSNTYGRFICRHKTSRAKREIIQFGELRVVMGQLTWVA